MWISYTVALALHSRRLDTSSRRRDDIRTSRFRYCEARSFALWVRKSKLWHHTSIQCVTYVRARPTSVTTSDHHDNRPRAWFMYQAPVASRALLLVVTWRKPASTIFCGETTSGDDIRSSASFRPSMENEADRSASGTGKSRGRMPMPFLELAIISRTRRGIASATMNVCFEI